MVHQASIDCRKQKEARETDQHTSKRKRDENEANAQEAETSQKHKEIGR